jgi:UDP-glucose:(heptosyl)LPS alpha-1,3-glucosyltransferase
MKIGLVRRGFSATGGAEAYLRRFALAATQAGHQCVLFATDDWPAEAWRPSPEGPHEIVRVPGAAPRPFADGLEALRPLNHCDFLFSLERVWRCDAYRAGDGVHAVWLERRAGYEPFWKSFARRFNRKHAALLALESSLFAGNAGMVIANSGMVKTEIEERFHYPPQNIHVVYNGVPPENPPPETRQAVRRELGAVDSDYVVLFVGSGWDRKGARFAVEAVNRARSKPVLWMAGRGDAGSMPASKRTRYLGPRNDVARLLAAADAFILPTLYEPFSNACLEALAAGLPVITTHFNGFAEILAPGHDGEVVADPRNTEALAAALDQWAAPDRRQAIRPELLAKGARFSIEENVRQTLEHIAPGS